MPYISRMSILNISSPLCRDAALIAIGATAALVISAAIGGFNGPGYDVDPKKALILPASVNDVVRDIEELSSAVSAVSGVGFARVSGFGVVKFQNHGVARYARAPVSGLPFDADVRPASQYEWDGDPDALVLDVRIWGMAEETCEEAAAGLNDAGSSSPVGSIFPFAECNRAGPFLTYVFM